jgi:hypothetical protein
MDYQTLNHTKWNCNIQNQEQESERLKQLNLPVT